MGFIGMSIALGVLVGPVVGGVLYHSYGYLAVFISGYANSRRLIPFLNKKSLIESAQLVALDFLLRILMLPSPRKANIQADATYGTFSHDQDNAETPPDETQRRTSRSSRPPPTSSTNPSPPPTPKATPPTHRHPMLTLLTTPRMLAAILADFMQSVVLTGLETILPLRIKLLFHYNSKQVALVFLVLTIPSFSAPAVGLLSDRAGAKPIVALGFTALAPLLVLLRLVTHDSGAQVALLSFNDDYDEKDEYDDI
ncbi:hypothetical protein HO133_003902 [Letharia lupina]|uniref:Major facilitator superfamily (MFS) profile domain-containing protein n=1 Tax=Letharia lupina TaxID=560253 RepID=A0A8H6CA18_9LECA|nr:uncharacterized protein HO133_003902 [Letharia lupina]KAF6219436.1 hypothetical protein HO133_003902 [Letharia lupina]